jgi:nucleoside-diphosphate-sugar epimerase
MRGDLEAPDENLARFADGLDILYHCAGELYRTHRMHAVNVDGTGALLLAAEGRIGRWVQLSSIGVYGMHRDGTVAEETPIEPAGMYERSKADADTLVLEAARRGLVSSAAVLRPSIVFGPEMPNQSLAGLIRIIERGLFFFIGTPGASANYVHVSNVVNALMLCGTSSRASGRVYNLSDWCTIEDLAGAIADALGKPYPRLRLPELPVRVGVRTLGKLVSLPLTEARVDALVNRCRYSIGRIQRELGFNVGISIGAGIEQMVVARRAA